jgi:hypothetical protein
MRWVPLVVSLAAGFAVGFTLASWIYHLTLLPWGVEFFYLLVAGGFGGLAQALITGSDSLRPPRWLTDADRPRWDAGFLADVFIGMLGATVSLLFALALLSDRFFGVVGDKQPDLSVPAWVRVVAFGALTGFASRQLLPNLSKRLSDMITQEVKTQTAAATQRIEGTVTRLAALAQTRAEVAQLAAAAIPRPQLPAVAAAAGDGFARLRELVVGYAAINEPDEEARLAARMEAADAMLRVLTENGITSEALCLRIENEPAKEFVLPLATLIAARPAPGDARRLLDTVDARLGTRALKADATFILQRVLLAIVALHDKHRLPAAERPRALALARECRDLGVPDLARQAEAVLALLG